MRIPDTGTQHRLTVPWTAVGTGVAALGFDRRSRLPRVAVGTFGVRPRLFFGAASDRGWSSVSVELAASA